MTESIEEVLNKHVGSILAAICVAAVVGGYGLVHQNDTNNKLTLQQMSHLSEKIDILKNNLAILQSKLDFATNDRWTRNDHLRFEREIDTRFDKMNQRLIDLERAQNGKR